MKALALAAVWLALPAWAANPLEGIFGPENLKTAQAAGVKVEPAGKRDTLLLRFPASETPGSFTVPVPPAAADWSKCGAFTFEFVSNSTIRWEMQIRNRRGQTFTYRVQPYQDVPAKAAISNAFLTREYMNNRQYKAHWLSNWANHIDLTQVASIAIRMAPDREVTLRLGPLALEPQDTPDEFRLGRPVVDALGQWIGLDWPGKVRTAAGPGTRMEGRRRRARKARAVRGFRIRRLERTARESHRLLPHRAKRRALVAGGPRRAPVLLHRARLRPPQQPDARHRPRDAVCQAAAGQRGNGGFLLRQRAPPVRRSGLRGQVEGAAGAALASVGLQHCCELVRRGFVRPARRAFRDQRKRGPRRPRLAGLPGCLLRGVRRFSRATGGAAVRAVPRRSPAHRLFHRQRAALARTAT